MTQEKRSKVVSAAVTLIEKQAYETVASARGCFVSDLLRGPETTEQIVEAFQRIRAVASKPAA